MRRLARAIAMLVMIASVARAERRETARLPTELFVLGNGLHVMLAPDPAATSITVHVRYERGAHDEGPGESGYTQLVERLLFMGSVHVRDFEGQVEGLGGWTTARTAVDHLGTTTTGPPHALERVLWLEAERMAGLVEGITPTSLARARDDTRVAWQAAYIDERYAVVEREVAAALWPGALAGYGTHVLGDGEAVGRARIADVRAFARQLLAPNHAIVVIAGKLDARATRSLAGRYFGWLPKREVAPRRRAAFVPATVAVERDVATRTTSVTVAYRCLAFDARAEIAAHVLAGDRHARLHRRLVATGLATEVRAEIARHAFGELRLHAIPAPGVDPAQVAAAIRDEATRLVVTDDEVARAAGRLAIDFYLAVENLAVRAELLAAWHASGARGALVDEWPSQLRAIAAPHLAYALQAPVTVIAREAR